MYVRRGQRSTSKFDALKVSVSISRHGAAARSSCYLMRIKRRDRGRRSSHSFGNGKAMKLFGYDRVKLIDDMMHRDLLQLEQRRK